MRDEHTFLFADLERATFMLDGVDPDLRSLPPEMNGDDLAVAFDIDVKGGAPAWVAVVAHNASADGFFDEGEGATPFGASSLCFAVSVFSFSPLPMTNSSGRSIGR